MLLALLIALLVWAYYLQRFVYEEMLAWSFSKVLGWMLVLNTMLFIYRPEIYSPDYARYLFESSQYKKALLGSHMPMILLIVASVFLTFPNIMRYKLSPRHGDMRERVLAEWFFIGAAYFLVVLSVSLIVIFADVSL